MVMKMVKRALFVILSVLMLLGAMGCNGGVKESTITTPVITTTQIPPATTPAPTPTRPALTKIEVPPEMWAKWETQNVPTANNTVENEIVELYLSQLSSQMTPGSFIVLNPVTRAAIFTKTESEEAKQQRREETLKYFADYYDSNHYDISAVYDRYIEVNQNPIVLTIKSSKADGYYIDYNNRLTEFLEGKYPGIEVYMRDFVDFPGYGASFYISMPAYDPVTGYVLMEVDFVGGMTSGGGNLLLFKYENGKLVEIAAKNLWIS
jgi:hypothetical protein